MALDEQYYDPTLPPEKIGVGAKPAKSTVYSEVAEFRGKRKIRISTQEKLGGQSQTLWSDIVGQAANAKPVKRDEWEDLEDLGGDMSGERSHHRDSDSRTNFLDQDAIKPKTGGMFANACFWIWGFQDKQTAALKKVILPHDGAIVDSLEELSAASEYIWRLVMVPREKRIRDCPTIPTGQDITLVTEWWMESCIFYQKFVTPMGDFTTMPIEEFEIEGRPIITSCNRRSSCANLYHSDERVGYLHHQICRHRPLVLPSIGQASWCVSSVQDVLQRLTCNRRKIP
jgi:DNA replication regulator DPB11